MRVAASVTRWTIFSGSTIARREVSNTREMAARAPPQPPTAIPVRRWTHSALPCGSPQSRAERRPPGWKVAARQLLVLRLENLLQRRAERSEQHLGRSAQKQWPWSPIGETRRNVSKLPIDIEHLQTEHPGQHAVESGRMMFSLPLRAAHEPGETPGDGLRLCEDSFIRLAQIDRLAQRLVAVPERVHEQQVARVRLGEAHSLPVEADHAGQIRGVGHLHQLSPVENFINFLSIWNQMISFSSHIDNNKDFSIRNKKGAEAPLFND